MCVGMEMYLKCTTPSNSLVCIECSTDILAEELDDSFLNGWNSSGPAHHLHCIDVIPAKFCNQTGTDSWLV